MESSKSIATLEKIKSYQSKLTSAQADSSFWLQKANEYGKDKKREVKNIFEELTELCELKNRVYSPDRVPARRPTLPKFLSAADAKLREDFILHDIEPIQPDGENQKLLRDFKLAQIAMFFIKQRVDRVTINDQHYIDLMQACYAFLVGYVRENLEN